MIDELKQVREALIYYAEREAISKRQMINEALATLDSLIPEIENMQRELQLTNHIKGSGTVRSNEIKLAEIKIEKLQDFVEQIAGYCYGDLEGPHAKALVSDAITEGLKMYLKKLER